MESMRRAAHAGPFLLAVAFRGWAVRAGLVAALAAALAAGGCRSTPVGVRRVGSDRVYREVNENALARGVPSEASTQVLARRGLLDLFQDDPPAALARLHDRLRSQLNRDDLFALAELSYLHAAAAGSKPHHLAAVVYAYLFLFGPGSQGPEEPFDPRFRLACELYNRSLTEFLRSPEGDILLAGGVTPLPAGTMSIQGGVVGSAEEFYRFLPASDFHVRGLRSRHRTPGLGVPLIAFWAPPGEGRKGRDFVGPRGKVPASAFLRIAFDPKEPIREDYQATLELHPPFDVHQLSVEGRTVPLENDLTAPLAYGLEEPGIWRSELLSFRFAEQAFAKPGIYLLQPHTPGKVPVVFVHGTASSPARWAETFNDLQAYREVRERFQFWFFIAPTGTPIAYTANLLREALHQVVKTLDPGGSDPALRRMVLIGHSQGGILTKMQVIDSGDRFWRQVFSKDPDQLDLPPEERDLLRRCLWFQRVPYVRRVVFIATPHQGSFLAAGWLGRLASLFVTMPSTLVQLGRNLVEKNEAHLIRRAGEELKIPTSIRNMDPNNRFLRTLHAIPIPPEVQSHSIIAVKGDGPVETGNDGLVEWKSAHLEGAKSEVVVRTSHSCQSHPMTIEEIHRILLEHLGESDSAASSSPTQGR